MQEFTYENIISEIDEYGSKFVYKKKMEEELKKKRDLMNSLERNKEIVEFISLTALSFVPHIGRVITILTTIKGGIEAFSEVNDFHVPVDSTVYFYSRIVEDYGGQRMIVVDPKGKIIFSRSSGLLIDSDKQIIKRINEKAK